MNQHLVIQMYVVDRVMLSWDTAAQFEKAFLIMMHRIMQSIRSAYDCVCDDCLIAVVV